MVYIEFFLPIPYEFYKESIPFHLKFKFMKLLESKVAIITGAGSGIEKAAAKLFAREGAKVIVSDISEKNGESAAEEIKNDGGEAFFIRFF